MSNVIQLGAYTRGDIPTDNVLEGAKGKLKQVLVLGICEDGGCYAAASTPDKGRLLLAVEEFKLRLLDGGFYED